MIARLLEDPTKRRQARIEQDRQDRFHRAAQEPRQMKRGRA
jgi:hypothetical protein